MAPRGPGGSRLSAAPPSGVARVSDDALPLLFGRGSGHVRDGSAQLCGWCSCPDTAMAMIVAPGWAMGRRLLVNYWSTTTERFSGGALSPRSAHGSAHGGSGSARFGR